MLLWSRSGLSDLCYPNADERRVLAMNYSAVQSTPHGHTHSTTRLSSPWSLVCVLVTHCGIPSSSSVSDKKAVSLLFVSSSVLMLVHSFSSALRGLCMTCAELSLRTLFGVDCVSLMGRSSLALECHVSCSTVVRWLVWQVGGGGTHLRTHANLIYHLITV